MKYATWVRLLGCVLAALVAGCPVEADPFDAGGDASNADASVCLCEDDGIACTLDRCDEFGACVHVGDCEGGWCAAFPDGTAGCAQHACTVDSHCRGDLPCAELVGCVDGFCRYDWAVDRDHDGERDRGCGGNDCQPLRPEIPGMEGCDGMDNDCDGVVDNNVTNIDFSSDPNNCGRCGQYCTHRRCVDGVCQCEEGRTMCGTNCTDTQSDQYNCGSCGYACPEGLCVEGVCTRRPPWVGLDRASYAPVDGLPSLDVSANGDLLFAVVLRPTELMLYGHPSSPIPGAAAPFTLHAVRLDRDGALVSITSLPRLETGRMLNITDDGFYFSGVTVSEFDLDGRHFASGVVLVGYVPRETGAIAWVHALSGGYAPDAMVLPSGTLAMIVGGSGAGFRPGEYRAIRLVGPDGVATTPPRPTDVALYTETTSLVATADGGFIAYPSRSTDSLPVVGPGPSTPFDYFAIRHDAFGRRVEAIRLPGSQPRLLCERPDSNAWIVQDYATLIELTRTGRRDVFTFDGPYPSWTPPVPFARYEGSGIAFGGAALSRLRGSTVVESVGEPSGGFHVTNDTLWTISLPGEPNRFLPEARVVIHRTELRAIP